MAETPAQTFHGLQACEGILATLHGEQPLKPEDPYLLREVAIILLDCGLRPEECHRLSWEPTGAIRSIYRVARQSTRSAKFHSPNGRKFYWSGGAADNRLDVSVWNGERTHGAIHVTPAA